jgi:hypothetical protein
MESWLILGSDPCSKNSPQFNDCLKNLLNDLYGSPMNKNNVKILKIGNLVIGSTKDFKVDGNFENVQFKGFEKLQITDLKTNSKVSMVACF